MLPFHHVCGYTLFPKARQIADRWVGIVDIVEGTGARRHQPTEDDFDTENAAIVSACIDAAGVANTLRGGLEPAEDGPLQ